MLTCIHICLSSYFRDMCKMLGRHAHIGTQVLIHTYDHASFLCSVSKLLHRKSQDSHIHARTTNRPKVEALLTDAAQERLRESHIHVRRAQTAHTSTHAYFAASVTCCAKASRNTHISTQARTHKHACSLCRLSNVLCQSFRGRGTESLPFSSAMSPWKQRNGETPICMYICVCVCMCVLCVSTDFLCFFTFLVRFSMYCFWCFSTVFKHVFFVF